MLFGLIIGAAGGLIAGWFLLPAPQFITNWWRGMFDKPPLVPQTPTLGSSYANTPINMRPRKR